MPQNKEKILVIKLSALGDFVQALGPMKAIRMHHPGAQITLLTTKAFQEFGERCGYFDTVIIDKRPKWYDLPGWLDLRKQLVQGDYRRVYDLQNNDRSCFYFRLFTGVRTPEWVGIARGSSHRNGSSLRSAGQAFEGHKQSLGLAGIENVTIDTLGWIKEDLSGFLLARPYALFVPGCAPQHPYKRWPGEYYAELGRALISRGVQVVLLGADAEQGVTQKIKGLCPDVLDLTGKTTLFQIVALAHQAAFAVGNDTGPMHLIAPTGCKTIVLFSGHSKPHRHAPRGENVVCLQENNLANLEPKRVLEMLS